MDTRSSGIGLLAILLAVLVGCKTPRDPHRVPENDVSGTWSAQSEEPAPMGWSLRLDQQLAGRLEGTGARSHPAGTSAFTVRGVRGTHQITMDFHFDETTGKFDGSVLSVQMIVGRLYMNTDTIQLTFQRD